MMDKNQVTKISPRSSFALEWKELVKNKQLLIYFIKRNFKVRYKQTAIGASWAIFKPFILMVVFTFAFNRVGNIEGGENIPYPIFAYAGLMFWTYFSQTVVQVGTSFITFESIIKKVYFPRIIVPLSVVATGLIDFAFSLLVYVGLMFYFGIAPTLIGVILFIPMVVLTSITVMGMGMFAAALNVKYRDVSQILPFIIQAMLFLTPVVYPVSAVPENLRWVLFLNPMTGIVDTVQAGLLGIRDVQWWLLGLSVISSLSIFFISLVFFKLKEREFADLI